MPNLFDDVQSETPDDGNIFNAVPAAGGGGIFDSLKGGPLLDRTATDNWRSTYTTPVAAQQAHAQNIFSTVGAAPTTSLPADHFSGNTSGNDSGLSGLLTGGLNLAKGAGQKFQDFQTMLSGGYEKPLDQPQDFGSIGSRVSNALGLGGAVRALGTAGNIVQAPLGLPSLLSGDPNAQRAAVGAYKTEGGDTPGIFDVPAVGRALSAGREAQAGALGQIAADTSQGLGARALAGGAQFALGALPNVAPLPFLPARGGARVAERPAEPLALAPRRQLALPEPQARPAPEVIPMRPGIVDTTAREVPTTTVETPATPVDPFRAQIDAAVARQRANPTPPAELANRFPISARDTGGGKFAVPLDAEQIAAQRGEVTPVQQAHADNLGIQVADRNAANLSNARDTAIRNRVAELAAQPAESAAPTSLSQQLADSLRAKGRPDLIVGETKPVSDFVRSNPAKLAIHNANEALIAAYKAGDMEAAAAHARTVVEHGGSLDYSAQRMRAAGLPAPTKGELNTLARTRVAKENAGGVSTERAGGTGGLGGFLRQEAGSTSVRNALGLGLGNLLRGPRMVTREGNLPHFPKPNAPSVGGAVKATGRGLEETLKLAKGLVTPFAPLHAGLRHAAPLLLAPSRDLRYQKAWLAGAKGSAKTYASFIKNPEAAREQMTTRLSQMRDTLDSAGYNRVEIKNPHGSGKYAEEWTPSNLPNKIPGLGRFFEGGSAGFTMFLNEARYAAAKLINNGSDGLKPSDKAGIADRINHFTGRGFRTDNEKAQAIGRMASLPFFSPQLQSSYARQIGDTIKALRDPMKAENKATLQMATGQLAATGGLLFAGAALGLPVILDATDSNFGKIDLGTKDQAKGVLSLLASQVGAGTVAESNGHVYLDATHGMAGYIKALAQTIANVAGGSRNKYGDINVGDPLANLIVNHLAPVVHEGATLGRAFLDPRHRKDEIATIGAVSPITAQGPIEAAGGTIPGSFTFNDLFGKPSAAPKSSGGLAPFSSARPDLQVPGADYAQPTQPPPVKTARPVPTRKPTATVKR